MDLKPYPGLDFLIESARDFDDFPEGTYVKVWDRDWRSKSSDTAYRYDGVRVGYVREVEHFVQTDDYLITIEVKYFSTSWSDAEADPFGDLKAAAAFMRKNGYASWSRSPEYTRDREWNGTWTDSVVARPDSVSGTVL